jgi:hypothetical protein
MRILSTKPPLTLCHSQIQALALPIGSKILIELSNSRLENYQTGLGKEVGYITVTNDCYTLKFDSEDDEITEANICKSDSMRVIKSDLLYLAIDLNGGYGTRNRGIGARQEKE